MNSRSVFIIIIILATCSYSSLTVAKFGRVLKAKEVKVLEANIAKNPKNLNSRLFLGHHYFQKNMWNKVVSLLGPVTEKLKKRDLRILAKAYLMTGDTRQAEILADNLLSSDSVSLSSYLTVTEILSEAAKATTNASQKTKLTQKLFETLKTAQKEHPTKRKIYDQWKFAVQHALQVEEPHSRRPHVDLSRGLKMHPRE